MRISEKDKSELSELFCERMDLIQLDKLEFGGLIIEENICLGTLVLYVFWIVSFT